MGCCDARRCTSTEFYTQNPNPNLNRTRTLSRTTFSQMLTEVRHIHHMMMDIMTENRLLHQKVFHFVKITFNAPLYHRILLK